MAAQLTKQEGPASAPGARGEGREGSGPDAGPLCRRAQALFLQCVRADAAAESHEETHRQASLPLPAFLSTLSSAVPCRETELQRPVSSAALPQAEASRGQGLALATSCHLGVQARGGWHFVMLWLRG